jgi:hypothetical protein
MLHSALRNDRPFLAFGLAMICLSSGSVWVHCQEPANVSLEAVVKAWQERQDRVRSGVFTWTETRMVTRGSISAMMTLRGNPKGNTIPAEDLSFDVPVNLSMDGEKLRHEYEGERQWSEEKDALVPISYASAYDGSAGKFLYPRGTEIGNWPQATIRAEKGLPDAKDAELRPILMNFRGLIAEVRYLDVGKLALTGRRADIEGASCVELQRVSSKSGLDNQLWVDPARDFVVVRYSTSLVGKSVYQITVQYLKDASGVWVPTSWVIINHPPVQGESLFTTRAAVKDYKLNVPLDSTQFDLAFPPGTRVSDEKSKLEYIVKQGEDKRIILKEDIGATYQQMLDSPPGQGLAARHGGFSWTWVSVGLAVLGASALAFFAWRRVRAKRSVNGR